MITEITLDWNIAMSEDLESHEAVVKMTGLPSQEAAKRWAILMHTVLAEDIDRRLARKRMN